MKGLDVFTDISEKYLHPQVLVRASTVEEGNAIASYIQEYNGSDKLAIKQEDSYVIIDKKEIIYASVNQKIIFLYTATQEIRTRKSLAELMKKLDANVFYQISKSAIVNIQGIKKLEVAFSGNYYAYLANGMKIVISRRFIETLKNKFKI